MRNEKLFFAMIFLTFWIPVHSQTILNRFSFSSGVSLSVTQWGLMPTSEIRKWDRSIASLCINLRYYQPIKKNGISFGLQLLEKGFRTSFTISNNFTSSESAYQYRLHYLELPIYYHFSFSHKLLSRSSFYSGVCIGYLFKDDYRYSQTDVQHPPGTSATKTTFLQLAGSYEWGNRFRLWDIGIVIGTSYKLNELLGVEFGIQKGLINIEKNFFGTDLAYNLTFNLGFNYRFLALTRMKKRDKLLNKRNF